ncbi:hypothetical protein [Aliamphritea spongicola]|nr:hypothetical protein [Aliamphritea spongicola]
MLTLSTLMRALPVFVTGLLVIILFALELQWFPVAGFGSASHLVLPMLALGLSLAAVSNRVVHNEARKVIQSPFLSLPVLKA